MSRSFTHDLAVIVGRFQPFLKVHAQLLDQALDAAPHVMVVIGSAHHAVSPNHPFEWPLRAAMITTTLPPDAKGRVDFEPLRDHVDDRQWFAALRDAVAAHAVNSRSTPRPKVILIGHVADPTRDDAAALPGWTLRPVPRLPAPDDVAVRDALFDPDREALSRLEAAVPAGVLSGIEVWRATPARATLADEWALLRRHQEAWAVAPYPVVLVTVDCVVQCAGHVLVIRRGHAPGKGLRAMPGGFIDVGETTLQSALRELEEETHLDVPVPELVSALAAREVFDRPDRSERGRTITHGFHFDLGGRALPSVRADDDAAAAEWMPLDRLEAEEASFLDDHFQMIEHFLRFLPSGSR